jgi:hypothetical protein
MLCHGQPDLWPHIGHGVADGLNDVLLFFGLNAKMRIPDQRDR